MDVSHQVKRLKQDGGPKGQWSITIKNIIISFGDEANELIYPNGTINNTAKFTLKISRDNIYFHQYTGHIKNDQYIYFGPRDSNQYGDEKILFVKDFNIVHGAIRKIPVLKHPNRTPKDKLLDFIMKCREDKDLIQHSDIRKLINQAYCSKPNKAEDKRNWYPRTLGAHEHILNGEEFISMSIDGLKIIKVLNLAFLEVFFYMKINVQIENLQH